MAPTPDRITVIAEYSTMTTTVTIDEPRTFDVDPIVEEGGFYPTPPYPGAPLELYFREPDRVIGFKVTLSGLGSAFYEAR